MRLFVLSYPFYKMKCKFFGGCNPNEIFFTFLDFLQFEARMRTPGQDCQGSTTLRGQRVGIGVLLATIRTVRMIRGAGTWQVFNGTMTGGAPRAQVGPAETSPPTHLSQRNPL